MDLDTRPDTKTVQILNVLPGTKYSTWDTKLPTLLDGFSTQISTIYINCACLSREKIAIDSCFRTVLCVYSTAVFFLVQLFCNVIGYFNLLQPQASCIMHYLLKYNSVVLHIRQIEPQRSTYTGFFWTIRCLWNTTRQIWVWIWHILFSQFDTFNLPKNILWHLCLYYSDFSLTNLGWDIIPYSSNI